MRKRADNNIDWARRTLLAAVAIAPALGTRVAGAAASASKGAGLPADLARAVRDYDQATLHNDVATLSSLVADDYVLVNSDASVENKQQYLADFNLPGFKIEPSVREQPVEKAWNDAAVVGGLVHLRWTQDGTRQARVIRIAHVWALRDGQWRLTYTQVTRAPNQ